MYESFYGFREKPFSLLPDPRHLFLNNHYDVALSLLEFGVLNQNGMILLTGNPGMGKTTLIQKILDTLDTSHRIGMITYTQDRGGSLLPWIIRSLGLPMESHLPTDMFHTLDDFFSESSQQGKGVLVIVDEAQNLEIGQLEELRLLYNQNNQQRPVVQILISGHSQLREQLKDPQLIAFVQRIGTDFCLKPFDLQDTEAYIRHRMQSAGGSGSLFSKKACDIVYQATEGNPRLINQLCDTALIYGYSDQATSISGKLMSEVAKDRMSGGILPLRPFTVDESPEEPLDSEPVQPTHHRPEPIQSFPPKESVQSDPLRLAHYVPELIQHPLSNESEQSDSLDQDYHTSKHVPSSRSNGSIQTRSNPRRNWEEGINLEKAGWYLEAISYFKQAANHPEFLLSGWFHAGQCYQALGRTREAAQAYRNALVSESESPKEKIPLYHVLSKVLQDLGEFDKANHFIQLIRSIDPTFNFKSPPPNHLSSASDSEKAHEPNAFSIPSQWFHCYRRWWGK